MEASSKPVIMRSIAVGVALALCTLIASGLVTVAHPDRAYAAAAGKPTIAIARAATGSVGLKQGASYKLGARATKGKLTYKSSKPKVAAVSSKGVVKAKAPGKATITVMAKAGKAKALKKVKVTVVAKAKYKKPKSIALKLPDDGVQTGKTAKLKATVKPANTTNKNVTYRSSNPKVVAVDAEGKLTGKAPGTATITVSSCENAKVTKKYSIVVANAASDFEYAVGDYILDGKVCSGAVSALNTVNEYSDEYGRYRDTKKVVRGYGTLFDVSEMHEVLEVYKPSYANGKSGGSGTSWDTADCGYGVYITKYIGSSKNIVVPKAINGVPVVYCALEFEGDTPGVADLPAYALNFSQASLLKCVGLWGHFSKMEMGRINKIANFDIGRACFDCAIDLSGQTALQGFRIFAGSSWPGLNFSTDNMRELMIVGGIGVRIDRAPKLESLSLPGCSISQLSLDKFTRLKNLNLNRSRIESFDLSKNADLVSLDVSGTALTKLAIDGNPKLKEISIYDCDKLNAATLASLKAWGKVEGHKLYGHPEEVLTTAGQ